MGQEIKKAPAPCCIILGAGDILDYGRLRGEIPPGCAVICADGGLRHCEGLGLRPDLLVGDLDSVGEVPPDIPQVTCDAVEKDYTDTALAVDEAIARGHTKLLLWGMLGGKRPDHTLANVQLLLWCAARGADATIADGVSEMYPLVDGDGQGAALVLEPRARHYFSLIPMAAGCGSVTIEGGKYPLDDYPLTALESPRAVSNEFVGKKVTIALRSGALVVVVTPME